MLIKPMLRHVYRPVYFQASFFSRKTGQFWSTCARMGKEKKWLTSHQDPITSSGEMMTSVNIEVRANC